MLRIDDFQSRVLAGADTIAADGAAAAAIALPDLLQGASRNRDVPLILDLPSEPSVTGGKSRGTIRIPRSIDVGRLELILQSDGRPGRFLGIATTAAKLKTPLQDNLNAVRLIQIDYQGFGNDDGAQFPGIYWPHYHAGGSDGDIKYHHPL